MSETKQTIAIVDDHPIVLEGLIKLLERENDFLLAGSFVRGSSLLNFLDNNPVDLIIVDIALPDLTGMELCRKIKEHAAGIIVLAFSNHSERSAIIRMLDNGASGYILKSAPAHQIIACIKQALEGKVVFSDEIRDILSIPEQILPVLPTPRLTVREKEILKMIASGITTPQIAKTLFISKFTVENHRKNLLQKLQVKNVAALIAEAARTGLI